MSLKDNENNVGTFFFLLKKNQREAVTILRAFPFIGL